MHFIDLHCDIESSSELDLFEVGTDAYARHPSTKILMVSWKLGPHGEIFTWTIADGPPPRDFMRMLVDPNIRKWAHNSWFERALFMNVWMMDLPIPQWRCTMTWAYGLGLPGSLDKLGKVLLLPEEMQKLAKEGKRLIKLFCQPQKLTKKKQILWRNWITDPEDWAKFVEYNRQDVVAEAFIAYKRLARYELPDSFWEDWHIDVEMNERGLPQDRLLITNAAAKVRENTEWLLVRMVELTGLDNPNSDKQFGPWIRARGYPYNNLKKGTVLKVLDDPEMSDIHEVLTIRSQLKRTAVKKFLTLEQYISDDDRLRYTLQFSAASRTGRTGGRGPHIQNATKPDKVLKKYAADITEAVRQNDWGWIDSVYGEPMKAISTILRSSVRAGAGKHLKIADYAQIEARIIAWLANCQAMLKVFHDDRDIYRAFGHYLFGKDYEDITPEERDQCKPPVLGCGFRLSGGGDMLSPKTGDWIKTGLYGYADNLGIPMTIEQAAEAVEVYRSTYVEVPQLWYDLEGAAKQVITRGGTAAVGKLAFDRLGPFLRMILPNGDCLHYLRPNVEKRKTPWGAEKWMVTFEGQEESESGGKFWGRQATHGGKLAENAAQAISNRILRRGLREARTDGFLTVGTLHDEGIAEDDDNSGRTIEGLCVSLCRLPPCYDGLPVKAEGRIAQVFGK